MSRPDLSVPGGLTRAAGYPGMVLAGETHAIYDFINDSATPIDFGVGVALGAADGNCKPPAALTDKLLGVSVRHVTMPANYGGGNTVRYDQYKGVPVLQEGKIYATAAQAVTRGDKVAALLNGAAVAAVRPGGNTGNGTITLDATDPTPAGAQVGTYQVRCTTTASNGGTFTVTGPDGLSKGTVAVGATFENEIKFAIADGSTDFAKGDGFDVVVAGGLLGSGETTAMKVTAAEKAGGNTGAGTLTLDPTTPALAGAQWGTYTVTCTNVTDGSAEATGVPATGNTGNATIGTVTPTSAATIGLYRVVFTAATAFTVYGPTGAVVGTGSTGSAFSAGGLGFTITAGATPCVAGDEFIIRVVDLGVSVWSVTGPDGNVVGTAKSGTAFADEIKFTIAEDGTTKFVAGDAFTVAVGADRIPFDNAYWETTTAAGALGIVRVLR